MIWTRVLSVGAVLLVGLASCQMSSGPEVYKNENKNLHGIVEEQQAQIDKLTADRITLDRRVKELEAKITRMQSTENVVEQAKDEISEHVRQVLARFKGDDEIEVSRTAGGYRFILREAVLFGLGSANLTDEGKRALARIAGTLKGADSLISIEGHTDDVPVKKPETLKQYPRGNIELSVGRAFAVWDYLTKEAKVKEDRVGVTGFGPHRPSVPNTSEMNRWRNRRVEILVQER